MRRARNARYDEFRSRMWVRRPCREVAQEGDRMSAECRKYGTRDEVAKELGISTKTVDRLVGRGALPKPVRLSARCVRFDMAELSAFLDEAKQVVKGPVMAGGMT